MKAIKLSLAALIAASSFAVFAADSSNETTNDQSNNVFSPQNVVVVDGKEYYCPRGFDVSDCPRLNAAELNNFQGRGPQNGLGPKMGPKGALGPNGGPRGLHGYHYGHGYHNMAHLRPHRGQGMARVMNTYCPKHQTLLGNCLGDDFDKTFKDDFDNLQSLSDQAFIKHQVLKARVADGDDASAITKYAQDVNNARRAHRDARYALDQKIRDYIEDHITVDDSSKK